MKLQSNALEDLATFQNQRLGLSNSGMKLKSAARMMRTSRLPHNPSRMTVARSYDVFGHLQVIQTFTPVLDEMDREIGIEFSK